MQKITALPVRQMLPDGRCGQQPLNNHCKHPQTTQVITENDYATISAPTFTYFVTDSVAIFFPGLFSTN